MAQVGVAGDGSGAAAFGVTWVASGDDDLQRGRLGVEREGGGCQKCSAREGHVWIVVRWFRTYAINTGVMFRDRACGAGPGGAGGWVSHQWAGISGGIFPMDRRYEALADGVSQAYRL